MWLKRMTASYVEAGSIGSNIKQQAGIIFGQRFFRRNFAHITNPIGGNPVEFFFFNIYLFIYLVALGLSCGMWTLSCGMHVGSSSLTKDRTRAPCLGSAES